MAGDRRLRRAVLEDALADRGRRPDHVPTFIVGGLHDIFQRGEPLLYERLKNRVPTRLLIGPWTHTTVGERAARATACRRSTRSRCAGSTTTSRGWTRTCGDPEGDAVHLGRGALRDADRLAAIQASRRRGSTSAPAGSLAASRPSLRRRRRASSRTRCRACARSRTSQWSAGLLAPVPCTTDNRLDEANGAILHDAAARAGPAALRPALRQPLGDDDRERRGRQRPRDRRRAGRDLDGADGGWLAGSFRAVDRARSRYVNGQLLQPWHPFTRESVLAVMPGAPIELPVEIFPTNAVSSRPGHSLRIAVGPNDFPHAVPPACSSAARSAGSCRCCTTRSIRRTWRCRPSGRARRVQAAAGGEPDPG